jgi:Tfp pilus assembly protein PilN
MKEIDFLPAAYREKNAVQTERLCQLAMVVTFGAIIGLAACFQVALYRAAQQDLTRITPQHDDALAKATQLAALHAEVNQSREFAELYTYLKYPWPRTQMLAEITRNLPPQVTLRELTIVEEPQQMQPRGGVIAVEVTQERSEISFAKADLDLLRREQDYSRAKIQVSGTTTDSGALHLFVMALNGTPLLESAKLHSMEAVPGSQQAESNFFIRLKIRPGYGQPGGPHAPRSTVAQGNSERSLDRS